MILERTLAVAEYLEAENLICSLGRLLTQVTFIQSEITQSFFEKWQPMNEEKHLFHVAYEFERYSTFADIVSEKLYGMEQELNELKKLFLKELSNDSSKVTTHE